MKLYKQLKIYKYSCACLNFLLKVSIRPWQELEKRQNEFCTQYYKYTYE